MFRFILLIKIYNKVQSYVYWVKYVKTLYRENIDDDISKINIMV